MVFHDGNTELDCDNSEESSTRPTSPELLHRAGMVQLQEFEEDERADSSDVDQSFTGSGVSQLWPLGIAGSLLDESHDDELSPVELSLSECQICFEYTLIEHRSCCDFKVCHECFNRYLIGKVSEGVVDIHCLSIQCSSRMCTVEIASKMPSANWRGNSSSFWWTPTATSTRRLRRVPVAASSSSSSIPQPRGSLGHHR